MLKITLVKSTIGAVPKHKKTIEALGPVSYTHQVQHLVKVEEA